MKFNINMSCEEFRLAVKTDLHILNKAKLLQKYG